MPLFVNYTAKNKLCSNVGAQNTQGREGLLKHLVCGAIFGSIILGIKHLADEKPEISLKTCPTFINFSDPKVLNSYIDPQFKTFSKIAEQVARSTYESRPRPIQDSRYGVSFSIQPEILAYIMQLVKGKVVVEIAGARGENSVLLAFAGAEKVYMNDIVPQEVDDFRRLRNKLPSAVQDKLVAVEGNCFELLQKHQELKGRIDFILCRNLIHLLTDKDQSKLFQTTQSLLKPGGMAIFTVNSAGNGVEESDRDKSINEITRIYKKQFNSTCFTHATCLIDDSNSRVIDAIYRSLNPVSGDKMTNSYENTSLYENTLFGWIKNNEAFRNKVDPVIKPALMEAIEESNILKQPYGLYGRVRLLTGILRAYTNETLSELLEEHGFEVIDTYGVSLDGHLVVSDDKKNLFIKSQQIGVIVRKKLDQGL